MMPEILSFLKTELYTLKVDVEYNFACLIQHQLR